MKKHRFILDRIIATFLTATLFFVPQQYSDSAEGQMAALSQFPGQDRSSTNNGLRMESNTVQSASSGVEHSFIVNSLGMKLRLIQPGTFIMGTDNGGIDEKPVHQVTLSKPFYIGIYEVTQEEYIAIMGKNPSRHKKKRCPVEMVDWEDAMLFCEKLNEKEKSAAPIITGYRYRLPTEAEWEYACRAGSNNDYCFGDDVSQLGEYAWYDENSGASSHPVGTKKPNAWGLFDMHGNVWEWCLDYRQPYPKGSVTDPSRMMLGSYRVNRGGGRDLAKYCRSATRDANNPGFRYDSLGFRVVFAANLR